MLPAAIGWGLSALGAGFGWLTQRKQNEAAKREAERNREFQERMSSTAVQRSVADYIKAGLNPGLAYDRSASSPSGSMASFDNTAANSAISNATRFAEFEQNRRIQREAHEAAMTLTREQAGAQKAANAKATADAELAHTNNLQARQALAFNLASQPALLRQAQAQATLHELGIPAARNAASLEEFLGGSASTQALRNRSTILPAIIRGMQINGPRAAKKAGELFNRLNPYDRNDNR